MTEQIYTPQDVETIVAVLKLIRGDEANNPKSKFVPDDEILREAMRKVGEAFERQIKKAFGM